MKIFKTKKGQPYIIKANGRAQFIKKNSSNTRRTRIKTRTRGLSMARHKKRYFSGRKSSGMGGLMTTILAAGAYGAFREKVSNAMAPVTSMIPLGNISDEVGLGIAAILVKKYAGNKIPMLKQAADAALVIESARIGQALISGQVTTSTSSSNTTW